MSQARARFAALIALLGATCVAGASRAQIPIASSAAGDSATSETSTTPAPGVAADVGPSPEPPRTSAPSTTADAGPISEPPTRPAPSATPESSATANERALAPPSTTRPVDEHRLKWRFPRFRWWEYAAAGVVSVGNVSLEILYDKHPKDRWTKPILADSAVRNLLRADSDAGIRRAQKISDFIWYGSTYYVVADGILTPLVSDRLNVDVAFQLTLLNWQAIGTAGLVARAFHDTVGRTRPNLQNCSDDPDAKNHCEFRGASFIAGHAMMTSANAGLACADHMALPLYGGGIADKLVCPVMVTAALTVGVTRMVADKHWFSDTIAGWILGSSIGYGLPQLLHYRYVRAVVSPLPNTAFVPWGNATSGGLQFMGQL